MRKRGGILILFAMPAWVYIGRFWSRVHACGFDCYEMGSVAMPLPTIVRVATTFATFATLAGLVLLMLDLVRSIKGSYRIYR